ncbi:DUF2264 domain-containing protein [Pedobacter nyackensis]|uniref:DUF2264 domain-containing protein n=1 Tax=Pedobacter nyackensis TaxID=475255 RepID=A0A1W2AF38_9SPHI|nr:DUF2264 domain-containing protein [Pedobacter nyackensis]SMC59339.1 hypothetical protein SAMN04488101_101554 [Pedobacter nyackensis]
MRNLMKVLTQALLVLMLFSAFAFGQKKKATKKAQVLNDRAFWLQQMDKMVRPVLYNLAKDSLRINMPQITSIHVDSKEQRIKVQYVEVLGRVLSGIAPWLQLEGGNAAEVALRRQYREWVIQGLKNSLDSNAKDFMKYDIGSQQLVDASFVAFAFVRAPWLWENLDKKNQDLMLKSIVTTRRFRPAFSNWLLFSAMNEAFLAKFDQTWDPMRVDYALQQMEQWYVGDGMYKDGSTYAFDYYNSYVIHPYLAAISNIIGGKVKNYNNMFEKIKKRNERYAIIQERLINSDGTFPATGRSIIYRGAAFHHLADMAFRKALPRQLGPEQVRCALTAVIKKTLESPTTYKNGWLTIGLYGSQADIGDSYNNQGSPYLCTSIFLPLGLPSTDPFWSNPAAKWSAQKIWSGEDFANDHSVDLR